jgi:hypothetical protein
MTSSHSWTFPIQHSLVPKTLLLCGMEDRGREAVRSRALAARKASGPLSDLDDILVFAPSSSNFCRLFKASYITENTFKWTPRERHSRTSWSEAAPQCHSWAGNVRRGKLDGRRNSHSSTNFEAYLVLTFSFSQLNTAYRYTSKYCGFQYCFPYYLANRAATTATPFSRHRSFVTWTCCDTKSLLLLPVYSRSVLDWMNATSCVVVTHIGRKDAGFRTRRSLARRWFFVEYFETFAWVRIGVERSTVPSIETTIWGFNPMITLK